MPPPPLLQPLKKLDILSLPGPPTPLDGCNQAPAASDSSKTSTSTNNTSAGALGSIPLVSDLPLNIFPEASSAATTATSASSDSLSVCTSQSTDSSQSTSSSQLTSSSQSTSTSQSTSKTQSNSPPQSTTASQSTSKLQSTSTPTSTPLSISAASITSVINLSDDEIISLASEGYMYDPEPAAAAPQVTTQSRSLSGGSAAAIALGVLIAIACFVMIWRLYKALRRRSRVLNALREANYPNDEKAEKTLPFTTNRSLPPEETSSGKEGIVKRALGSLRAKFSKTPPTLKIGEPEVLQKEGFRTPGKTFSAEIKERDTVFLRASGERMRSRQQSGPVFDIRVIEPDEPPPAVPSTTTEYTSEGSRSPALSIVSSRRLTRLFGIPRRSRVATVSRFSMSNDSYASSEAGTSDIATSTNHSSGEQGTAGDRYSAMPPLPLPVALAHLNHHFSVASSAPGQSAFSDSSASEPPSEPPVPLTQCFPPGLSSFSARRRP